MATGGSSSRKGKATMRIEEETQSEDIYIRMVDQMQDYERLSGYNDADFDEEGDETQEPPEAQDQGVPNIRAGSKRPPPHPTTKDGKGGKSGATTSWVWQYFTKIPIENQTDVYNCKCGICGASYRWKRNGGTGTLTRHLETVHQLGKDLPMPSN